MWKTSTKQNFCSQIYYNIIFYYNFQNIQIQVLENRKQKIVTKHNLNHFIRSLLARDTQAQPIFVEPKISLLKYVKLKKH